MKTACVLITGVALLSGCGGSHERAFACPVSRGHSVVQPFNGRLIALGRAPVYVRIDNRGDLRHGVVMLGSTDFHGWFAIKSHFFGVGGYGKPIRVTAKRIDRAGVARLGASPRGGDSLSAAAAPDLIWFTWMRSPGCYRWSISGPAFHENVVVRAIAHHE